VLDLFKQDWDEHRPGIGFYNREGCQKQCYKLNANCTVKYVDAGGGWVKEAVTK
jgi:hypothetical protein